MYYSILWYVIDALSHLKRDGIHRGLVSKHNFSFGAVYYGPTQMQLKSQVLTKILFSGGGGSGYSWQLKTWSLKSWPSFHLGGGVLWNNSNPKSFNLAKFSWGGGGYSGHHILQILQWGTQGILSTKFYKPKLGPASQIVSHTHCVWRLNKEVHLKKYITTCICSVGEVHWCKTENLLSK